MVVLTSCLLALCVGGSSQLTCNMGACTMSIGVRPTLSISFSMFCRDCFTQLMHCFPIFVYRIPQSKITIGKHQAEERRTSSWHLSSWGHTPEGGVRLSPMTMFVPRRINRCRQQPDDTLTALPGILPIIKATPP